MKKLKKISLVILAIVGIIAIGIYIFIQTLKPTYNGEQEIAGLSNDVSVYYDNYGIPHIYGKNEMDAFKALGYVHAQDRLWQMELLRRIGPGRLSEVFGKDMVTTDKFLISLGIDEASEKTVAMVDKNSEALKITQAYLDGINAFIAEGPTPIEYYFTGLDKKPFVLKDVYNTIGYMAFSFAMAHKTDPLLSNIKETLGDAYLIDLMSAENPDLSLIPNFPQQQDSLKNSLSEVAMLALKKLPVPLFEGSNSWVIAPEKTKNGKVILANDPHISFSQPSVWYEAHISTPTYEKYGYHMAGIPFPLLGHDHQAAYGVTMFENDDINFYYEKEDGTDTSKYLYKGEWKSYEKVTKIIKVKDEADVTFEYKKSIHGPILNGIAEQIRTDKPIAMSWVYTQLENSLLEGLNEIVHANNVDEYKSGVSKIHAPGLNMMYGDADGNIGWFASAKLFQMPEGVNTKFVLDGSSGLEEPLKYLDFSQNPQSVNPPWNYVYSANNQTAMMNGRIYPGYYLPENRAKRITQLLDVKNDWDKESSGKMINDVTSAVNPIIVKDFISVLETNLDQNKASIVKALTNWDGSANLTSYEATIYQRWEYLFLKNTFLDELGEERFEQLLSTHFLKRTIAPLAKKEQSVWWDNIATEQTETKADIVSKSFHEAIASLKASFGSDFTKWTWDKVHTIEHPHPIGQVEALRKYFNVGPFPINGTREVINNLGFNYTDDGLYKVNSGPSTRRIIDFSDIENSISILPTGQSGNIFSPHYKDQAQMYVNGEFRKMLLNTDEIRKTAKSVLIIKPE